MPIAGSRFINLDFLAKELLYNDELSTNKSF